MNCREWFLLGYDYESGKILNFGDSYTIPTEGKELRAFNDGKELAAKHHKEVTHHVVTMDEE